MREESSAGVLSKEELEKTPGFPTGERLRRGPVVVIECPEEIPCDVCKPACPMGAIKVGKPITNLPKLDEDRCTGCGICVAACPGLAIFLVKTTFSEKEALVSFPYEFLPVPKVGSTVDAVDRRGEVITKGRIVKVRKGKDRTLIISLAVPKEFAQDVRGITLLRKE